MTNIPPLLDNGTFITNFQTKADTFNELFVQQCPLNQNNSVVQRFISRYNTTVLKNIEIDPSKILKIIGPSDSNKSYCWDSLSISCDKIFHA